MGTGQSTMKSVMMKTHGDVAAMETAMQNGADLDRCERGVIKRAGGVSNPWSIFASKCALPQGATPLLAACAALLTPSGAVRVPAPPSGYRSRH